jgi:hypothetical protein
MHVNWEEMNFDWSDISGSEHLQQIQTILGPGKRGDALHMDSAFKSGCRVFVTRDTNILSKTKDLKSVLSIEFLHPDNDYDELVALISAHIVRKSGGLN